MSAIIQRRERAIIITHATKIKNQWVSSFLNMTDIPEDRLYNIEDSSNISI